MSVTGNDASAQDQYRTSQFVQDNAYRLSIEAAFLASHLRSLAREGAGARASTVSVLTNAAERAEDLATQISSGLEKMAREEAEQDRAEALQEAPVSTGGIGAEIAAKLGEALMKIENIEGSELDLRTHNTLAGAQLDIHKALDLLDITKRVDAVEVKAPYSSLAEFMRQAYGAPCEWKFTDPTVDARTVVIKPGQVFAFHLGHGGAEITAGMLVDGSAAIQIQRGLKIRVPGEAISREAAKKNDNPGVEIIFDSLDALLLHINTLVKLAGQYNASLEETA